MRFLVILTAVGIAGIIGCKPTVESNAKSFMPGPTEITVDFMGHSWLMRKTSGADGTPAPQMMCTSGQCPNILFFDAVTVAPGQQAPSAEGNGVTGDGGH